MSERKMISASLAIAFIVLLGIRLVFGHDVYIVACCILTCIFAAVTVAFAYLTKRILRDIERLTKNR